MYVPMYVFLFVIQRIFLKHLSAMHQAILLVVKYMKTKQSNLSSQNLHFNDFFMHLKFYILFTSNNSFFFYYVLPPKM